MRHWIWVGLLSATIGTAFGFALGIFVYPYIFLSDLVAMETLSDKPDRTQVASGRFIHADPSDPIHYGRGGVRVYDDVVRLEADFEVGPGPKFHVYLVPQEGVRSEGDVEGRMFIDLGRLRAFKGSQNYPVPEGVDLSRYPSVVIWCEQFGVLISPADLRFEG